MSILKHDEIDISVDISVPSDCGRKYDYTARSVVPLTVGDELLRPMSTVC